MEHWLFLVVQLVGVRVLVGVRLVELPLVVVVVVAVLGHPCSLVVLEDLYQCFLGFLGVVVLLCQVQVLQFLPLVQVLLRQLGAADRPPVLQILLRRCLLLLPLQRSLLGL